MQEADAPAVEGPNPLAEDEEASKTPLQIAAEYVAKTREKKTLAARLKVVDEEVKDLGNRVMELIEAEQLPPSFKQDGATVFTREETWCSPLDGDHKRLAGVLRELGLVEYLPSTVNSQSLSAYVRGYYNKETGKFSEDLDPRLLAVLKVSHPVKPQINGA